MITLNLGKGIVLSVDKDRIFKHPALRTHAENIGLKNILQDSHAPFTIKDHPDTYKKLSRDAVERKLAGLYNGELRVNTPTMSVQEVLESADIEALEAMLKKKKAAQKAA